MAGVEGRNSAGGSGVSGSSRWADGVFGATRGDARETGASGLHGIGAEGRGVTGESLAADGVQGTTSGPGASGVVGRNTHNGVGVTGEGGTGVYGLATAGRAGVPGHSATGAGGSGTRPNGAALHGSCGAGGLAARFDGRVAVAGPLDVHGDLWTRASGVLLDNPFDPAGRPVRHVHVASPQRLAVVAGTVELDERGVATVRVPDWFEA